MKRFRHIFFKLLKENDSPEAIAGGIALGVFLGIFPTFGLGAFLALVLAGFLRLNRLASLAGAFINNPLTAPFFIGISALVGAAFFTSRVEDLLEKFGQLPGGLEGVISFFKGEGWERDLTSVLGIYLLGNTIVSLTFAALSYILSIRIINIYRLRGR